MSDVIEKAKAMLAAECSFNMIELQYLAQESQHEPGTNQP